MTNCSWLSVEFNDTAKTNFCESSVSCSFSYPCENQTECFPYVAHISPGKYFIEAHGAQGGSPGNNGGKGGMNSGIIRINKTMTLYVFIGAKGVNTNGIETKTAFNGGGSGYGYKTDHHVSSGGGATDIRLIDNDMGSRIIVSGGGGGSSYHDELLTYSIGGAGGGINGTDGEGGAQGGKSDSSGLEPVPGLFGFGGNGTQMAARDGCGGGGGYYGGAAGSGYSRSGGGGSGYIDKRYFSNPKYMNGINEGNGKLTIISMSNFNLCSKRQICQKLHLWTPFIIAYMINKLI